MSTTPVTLPSERAAAEQQQAQTTVHSFLASLVPEMQRALPKGLDADRMARLALTVVRRTPKLAYATRESFAGALLSAAALGLEPGVEGEAHLVPYEDHKARTVECQLIIGYHGLTKLFYQHPLARSLDAQAVYEADEFDYALGSDAYLRHKPALGDEEERGPILAYYAIAQFTNGGEKFVVLSPGQVRKLRQGRVGTRGDIADPEHWMERKTALRQLFKLVPKSPRLAEALVIDEQPGTELRARLEQQRTPIGTPSETLPLASAGSPRSEGEVAPDGASPSEPPDGEAATAPAPESRKKPRKGGGPAPVKATEGVPKAAGRGRAKMVEVLLTDLGIPQAHWGYLVGALLGREIGSERPLSEIGDDEADWLRSTLVDCNTQADVWGLVERAEQGSTS